MRSSRFGFLAVLATAAFLGGCDDEVTGGEGTGRLRVMLTDAPGDLAEAFVKIDQIVLVRSDADSTN